jgi:hypothetical protein
MTSWNYLLNRVKLDMNLENSHLSVQLKVKNGAKDFIYAYVMIHAQVSTAFICIISIQQYMLFQLNYTVYFNTFTVFITYLINN